MRRLLLVLWILSVLAWTSVLLIDISPTILEKVDRISWNHELIVAKCLHGFAYTYLTILAGLIRVPTRYRWIFSFFLAIHAAGTELAQLVLTQEFHLISRDGNLYDVAFDCAG